MQNIITYAKLAMKYVGGVCGTSKKEYDLQFVFVPEDNLWYIDMPWSGDRYNLAMVAGANKLLDYLSDEDNPNRVRVLVRPSSEPLEGLDGYFECERHFPAIDASVTESLTHIASGATYGVNGLKGFTREIWICPVTLTVLGHYPKYIYIKKV